MKRKYSDWVLEYPSRVVIKKEGYFYTVRGVSAYIIATILNYNISDNKLFGSVNTGSPNLKNMTDALKQHHISYVAIENDKIIDEESFNDNQFFEFVDEAELKQHLEKIKERKQKGSRRFSKAEASEIMEFIEALEDGIDPLTGEIYDEDHFINCLEMKEILRVARRKFEQTKSRISKDDLNDDEEILYEKLRNIRNKVASDENLSPYYICSNAVIASLCKEKPTNKEEMLKIKGIKDRLYEKIGEEFLNEISNYKIITGKI